MCTRSSGTYECNVPLVVSVGALLSTFAYLTTSLCSSVVFKLCLNLNVVYVVFSSWSVYLAQIQAPGSRADQGGNETCEPNRLLAGSVHCGRGAAQARGSLQVLAPLPQPQEAHRGTYCVTIPCYHSLSSFMQLGVCACRISCSAKHRVVWQCVHLHWLLYFK